MVDVNKLKAKFLNMKYNNQNQNLDKVILVNEQDEVVGQLDKVAAHLGSGQLHRACSVFLFNQDGELLVQRRSRFKIVAARQWGNTICGNVRPGENYRECAIRRLREELGVTGVELEEIGKFQYEVEFENGFSEREIDTVFAQKVDSSLKLNLNPSEVEVVDWIELTGIEGTNKKKGGSKKFAPWVFKILSQPEISQQLNQYVKQL